jgi:hypothetical protein
MRLYLRETNTVVAASSFLSLKGRVARTMLALADHFGQEVAPVDHKFFLRCCSGYMGLAHTTLRNYLAMLLSVQGQARQTASME